MLTISSGSMTCFSASMKSISVERFPGSDSAPGQAEAHFLLGTLYQQAGMETRAAEQFKKAVALEPDDERYRQAAQGPA